MGGERGRRGWVDGCWVGDSLASIFFLLLSVRYKSSSDLRLRYSFDILSAYVCADVRGNIRVGVSVIVSVCLSEC